VVCSTPSVTRTATSSNEVESGKPGADDRKVPFLPSDRFVIDTSVGSEEVRERLQGAVAPRRSFRSRRLRRPFVGQVGSASFDLRPVLGYNNSFAPVVRGSFASRDSGTQIDVRLSLFRPVGAFMAVWLSGAALFVGMAVIATIENPVRLGFVFLAFAFFGVGYGSMAVLFWREARRARRTLERLLAGEP
jgi:hypothetical protein